MKQPTKSNKPIKTFFVVLRVDCYTRHTSKVKAVSAKQAVQRVRKHFKTFGHVDLTHVELA